LMPPIQNSEFLDVKIIKRFFSSSLSSLAL
jgi:hypothetical protein